MVNVHAARRFPLVLLIAAVARPLAQIRRATGRAQASRSSKPRHQEEGDTRQSRRNGGEQEDPIRKQIPTISLILLSIPPVLEAAVAQTSLRRAIHFVAEDATALAVVAKCRVRELRLGQLRFVLRQIRRRRRCLCLGAIIGRGTGRRGRPVRTTGHTRAGRGVRALQICVSRG